LQPLLAIVFGVRSGLADAKSGQSPYILALLFHGHKRKELLRSGITAIGHVLAIGILLDAVAQLLIYKQIHPVQRWRSALRSLASPMPGASSDHAARRLQPHRCVATR
jgi:hypothetical protein